MSRRPWNLPVVFALFALGTAACGGTAATRPPLTTPAAVQPPSVQATTTAPAAVAPQQDPVQALIDRSQSHFDAGYAELRMGHLEKAKVEFNRALDVLLESSDGARSNARVRLHFDHLVDRISAFELRALAEGDGFAERPSVPASIDELLAISTPDSPTIQPELKHVVEADLAATAHDVPIPANARVLAYVEIFQGRLRDWFQASLQRGMAYLPMIQTALRAEGLPLDLAYIPIVESAFRSEALSRAKAKGMWQIMRGTAVENGLKYDWYVDERGNPEKATVAAAKYLKVLNRMFKGDWHLTLASYNGGPGTVQSAVRRKGVADFWRLAEKGRYLPRETKDYVPMVLAAIVIARNPGQYGFSVEPVDAPAPETVTARGAVDLRHVAEWAGVTVDEIQRLNPELRRWTTPVRSEGYVLKVPPGTAAGVQELLQTAPAEMLTALQWHTVKRGETLQSIANKLRVKRADLAEANYLSARTTVRPGQKLVIPRAPTTLLAARAERPEPVVAASRSGAPGAVVASNAAAPGELVKVTYRVKPGDTLTSIAASFRTSVARLRTWNSLRGDRISAGDRLTVYTPRAPGGKPKP